MISNGQRPVSAPAISSTSGPILPCSLRTGTTTDTAGAGALSRLSVPFMGNPYQASRGCGQCQLLWGQKRSGNRFAAPPRRPRQPVNCGVAADGKAQMPRGKPAPHQERADGPHDGTDDDVTGEMRVHDDPA